MESKNTDRRSARRVGGRIVDLSRTRERKVSWWGGDLSKRRTTSAAGAPPGRIAKPAPRAFDEDLARLEAIEAHNAGIRARRPIAMSRPRRIGRRGAAALLSLVLVAGIVAAVWLYESNRLTGTIVTTGGLSISGAFADTYAIGTTQRSAFVVTSSVANTVTAELE